MTTTQTFEPSERLKESQRYGTARIKFEREARDCPANDRLGNGASGGRFIYDWRVIIDGAHRCTFKKITTGNRNSFGAYQLYDCEGRPIRTIREERGPWPRHFGFPVESQAAFESTIQTLLYEMAIPTIREQMAETERLGQADAALRIDCETEAQTRALHGYARDMFEALARVIAVAEDGDTESKDFTPAERIAAIAQARMTYFAAHEAGARAIQGEREYLQIYLGKRS